MKVAIIGNGRCGIEAASKIWHLGGSPVLFGRSDQIGTDFYLSNISPEEQLSNWLEMTTSWSRELIKFDKPLENCPTRSEYINDYLLPVYEYLKLQKTVKQAEVKRIHKRFLGPTEKVKNKSRLIDLFRVVYGINPSSEILNQVKENPEVFKNFDSKIIESLKEKMESYEDFDLVIDARTKNSYPNPMGPDKNFSINEEFLKKRSPIYYGIKGLFEVLKLEPDVAKDGIIVGSGELSLLAIEKLREANLKLITSESTPFLSLQDDSKEKAILVLNKYLEDYKIQKNEFSEKINEWKSLEDYIKVKTPKPEEPFSKLEVLSSSNVTSVDKLIDRDGTFVTCERATFRELRDSDIDYKWASDLATLSCDYILVLTGHNTPVKKENEPGLYNISMDLCLNSQIESITQNILSFFSKEG